MTERRAKKLVLAVIDSLKPELLDRAIETGRAPALAALVERGTYVRDCVSSFPSVTPVASASITTGAGPDRHLIPSMNWYHRGEERYVEYGSSFAATRTFGIVRSLYDTVYNMNLAHLNGAERTVYEIVEDAGLRAACTTYLIFRGRHRHPADEAGPYTRIAKAAQFRHAVWGPSELFYADLFASQKTDCRSTLGLPGQRDRHAGCVAAHMVENDLFDFLLLSLPDTDTHSHRYGPYAQTSSIVEADRAIERMMHAGGGIDAFLEDHAVIVLSDHSQTPIEQRINLGAYLIRLGRYEAAIDVFRQALRINPANVESLTNLGMIFLMAGRHDEAHALLTALEAQTERLGLVTDANRNRLCLAALEWQRGRHEAALEHLAQALELASRTALIGSFLRLGRPLGEMLPALLATERLDDLAQARARRLVELAGRQRDFGRGVRLMLDESVIADIVSRPDVPELIRTSPLTRREWQILGLIHAGLSNEQIAEQLAVAPTTIKTHIRSLYQKQNIRRREEAIALAGDLLAHIQGE